METEKVTDLAMAETILEEQSDYILDDAFYKEYSEEEILKLATDIVDFDKICLECGHLISDEEYITVFESRGEFWGSPCSEEVVIGYNCGNCGNYENY